MKLLRLLFLLLFTISTVGKSNGQTVEPGLAAAFQQTLDSMRQLLQVNGLAAAIQLPDDAVWAGGSGFSTFNPVDSIGPQHTFEVGSSFKTVTAHCILQMADEGSLALDDSLYHWLPAFPHIDSTITIRQLLRHQSGLFDVLQNPGFSPAMFQNTNQLWSLADVIGTFILPANFQPGTSWGYSNTNYLLLGMIVETVSGQSFHQEVKERFFAPMGLESFANLAFDPLPNQVAHIWLDLNGDGVLDDAHNFYTGLQSTFSAVGPAGGYFATPSDLARWMKASMSGSLLSAAMWAEATTTVPSAFSGNTRYGLGLMERYIDGELCYGHGGDLSYTTQAFYFPEKDISIAIHSNDASIISWNLTNTLAALLRTCIEYEPTATEDFTSNDPVFDFTVFPNPFVEMLNIECDLPATVTDLEIIMSDISGKTIQSKKEKNIAAGNQVHSLENISFLPPGNYFVQLKMNGQLIGMEKAIKIPFAK
ncbi:MAG: serine hydrolase [Bacteroidota bacterium]